MERYNIAGVIGVIGICVFPVLWCGVICLISRIGGWSNLAQHYALQGNFSGTLFRFQSGKLGSMGSYGNCLTFGANEDGLYLVPFFLFRPGHHPLLIPWSDIKVKETRTFLAFRQARLLTRQVPYTPITISVQLAEKLFRAAGREWPREE